MPDRSDGTVSEREIRAQLQDDLAAVDDELCQSVVRIEKLEAALHEAVDMAEAGYAAPEDIARLRALAEGAEE